MLVPLYLYPAITILPEVLIVHIEVCYRPKSNPMTVNNFQDWTCSNIQCLHVSVTEFEMIHFGVTWGGIEIGMSVSCARRLPS